MLDGVQPGGAHSVRAQHRRHPIDLNPQQLRVFIVLGEELHFGRAADRLVLTQPYVSRTLAALERRIGGRLFERTSRKVRLTPLGEEFHAELTDAYDNLVRAFERTQTAAALLSGEVVVGCTTTSAGPALTSLVSRFEKANPEYRVRLCEVPLNHPYDSLRTGAVDVLMFWLPQEAPGLEWGPVIEEQRLVLVMRAGHPLNGREAVSIEALADYGIPAMADVAGPKSVENALWPSETPVGRYVPRVGLPCRTMSELADAVARSDVVKPTALSVARANTHREDLVFRPITDVPPLHLGPIWLAARTTKAIRAFAATANQVSRERRHTADARHDGPIGVPALTRIPSRKAAAAPSLRA